MRRVLEAIACKWMGMGSSKVTAMRNDGKLFGRSADLAVGNPQTPPPVPLEHLDRAGRRLNMKDNFTHSLSENKTCKRSLDTFL
jgi:hypothetical protein